MRNFRNLRVWQEGMEITKFIYTLTNMLPAEEKYGLKSQMQRAAISIPSNIAEGCSRNNNTELVRFLEIAIGSGFELETQLELSASLGYLSYEDKTGAVLKLKTLQASISSYRNFLRQHPNHQ